MTTISAAAHRRLEARIAELGLDRERVKRWVLARFGCDHLNLLTVEQYHLVDVRLDDWAAQQEAEREASEERDAIINYNDWKQSK